MRIVKPNITMLGPTFPFPTDANNNEDEKDSGFLFRHCRSVG
jgi:hypothetical protein